MLLLVALLAQGPVELHAGMVITRSVHVVPKTYRLRGAPIVVRGDDVTVDLRGATLLGAPTDTAIRIDGGHRVRIRNARIHGYKVGILARGTTRLVLDHNDLSHNWRPRLFSVVEHESLVDWLSFHHNEHDEWLRFGAAIYLVDVKGGALRDNVAVGGMNGSLLVRCEGIRIERNNFSFNSGLGVGLYRSSFDTIVHNQLDYNVRGYSHGFYTRGQDSADLLIYEQSNHNVVGENSLTHGGDGIFLWAGQRTMDSGTGGANDNFFYGNDVSYSTANGIEATFSRNTMVGNRAWGNEYGIWGGYSYNTLIARNDFRANRTGIAIEHGQANVIVGNQFDHDSTAIRLWADSIEPSDWGYPKHHDTRSRDYRIGDNVFEGNQTILNVRNTTGLDTTTAPPLQRPAISPVGRITSPPPDLAARDRSAIIVDSLGPYDYRTPKLWPAGDSTRAVPLHLATLGPAGRWRVVSKRGIATVSKDSGQIGDTIAVTPRPDSMGDWKVVLESRGQRFSYERFEPGAGWHLEFYSWNDSGPSNRRRLLVPEGPPSPAPTVHSQGRLDLMWYRAPSMFSFLPRDHWGLEATSAVTLPPGAYSIRTISDDAVRVWIDSTLAIDNWTPHESQVDYADLPAGRHALRVEYRQVDGWVELRLDIIRGRERPTGSPGPH
jgi:Periplasmic copper-binding protein (NosD)/PA14 domain